jgi:hypothetical protein
MSTNSSLELASREEREKCLYKLLWHGKNGHVVAPEAGLVQQLHDLLCLSHLPLHRGATVTLCIIL